MAVEVRVVADPAGGPAILLQLPDGFVLIKRAAHAREVADALRQAADELDAAAVPVLDVGCSHPDCTAHLLAEGNFDVRPSAKVMGWTQAGDGWRCALHPAASRTPLDRLADPLRPDDPDRLRALAEGDTP